MTKRCRAFFILIAAVIIAFALIATTVITYAETEDDGTTTESTTPEENDEEDSELSVEGLADSFTNYLKAKYGDDYEYYYNRIIEQWGSIEGYLLAFGNKLPDEYKTGWDKFVGWLNEYKVIWGTALAAVLVIIAVLIGKRKINKFKEWFTALVEKLVNKRLAPIENELNLQSSATISILHSQKALLGNSDRFSDNVKELEEAEKELNNE